MGNLCVNGGRPPPLAASRENAFDGIIRYQINIIRKEVENAMEAKIRYEKANRTRQLTSDVDSARKHKTEMDVQKRKDVKEMEKERDEAWAFMEGTFESSLETAFDLFDRNKVAIP